MTQVVNDTDKLTYILTDYGLQRITEALADPTVYILLTKVKVGDANFEYYTPQEAATELVHPIENGEFPLVSKELLEDNLTISLHAVFPEALNNCEIREVGIYETVNGEDKLFALSTQQPQLKPAESLGYFTVVDYYAFLKSQNLSDIYDQILLDPDAQLVTREELDNLMSTIAFTESNLMEQINGNSRVIGLNRAEQLRKEIESERNNLSYTSAYNNYSLLLNSINPSDIFGYWLFNYPRRSTYNSSVTDISINNRNLSTNKPINVYNRTCEGLMSTLNFAAPNFFYLDQTDTTSEFNPNAFEVIGTPSVNSLGIAYNFSNSNYIKGPKITRNQNDSVGIFFNFTIEDKANDYSIMFTDQLYTLLCYFDHNTENLVVKLGDGTEWVGTMTYKIPEVQVFYNFRVLFNNEIASLSVLLNETYTEKSTIDLDNNPAYDFGTLNIGVGYASYLPLLGSFNLKELTIDVNGNKSFSGSIENPENRMSFLSEDGKNDISFTMIFTVKPLLGEQDRTLIARSDYATNSNIFEVFETTDRRLKIRLFSDSSNYITFTSGINTVPTERHSVLFSYDANLKTVNAFIGGKKVNMLKTTTGTYSHMNNTPSALYSFTSTQEGSIWTDSNTNPTALYNQNGTPYTGSNWFIDTESGNVFYDEFLASYDPENNKTTDRLYAWNWNDGLEDHLVYTKELVLAQSSILYNENYTLYTGQDFKIVLSGSDYIVQYNGNTAEYTQSEDVLPKTLYSYYYVGGLQTIWANSSVAPSVLYQSNGNIYTGIDWTVSNGKVYYRGQLASYNSLFNLLAPSAAVTSYITQLDGTHTNYINSDIGIISVINNKISDEKLRSFALNLEATMGNNPCISIY